MAASPDFSRIAEMPPDVQVTIGKALVTESEGFFKPPRTRRTATTPITIDGGGRMDPAKPSTIPISLEETMSNYDGSTTDEY